VTSPAPAGPPGRDDLTARVFRALYERFDLHTVGGTYIAIPKGTLCFAARSLGEVARQISDHEHHDHSPARQAPADTTSQDR